MKMLRLDFILGAKRQSWRGQVFLFFISVALVSAYLYFQHVEAQADRVQLLVDASDHQKHKAASSSKHQNGDPQKTAERLKFYNHVVAQLNLPWEQLFSELEQTKGGDVGLLEIEPDPKTSKVKVLAEARNYKAMLAYVRALSEKKNMYDVYLIGYKMDDQNQDKPIRFSVEALWRLN
jgi:Tfp pilus assembly protein PilN